MHHWLSVPICVIGGPSAPSLLPGDAVGVHETIRKHSDLLGRQIYQNAQKKFPSVTHVEAVSVNTVTRRKDRTVLVRLVYQGASTTQRVKALFLGSHHGDLE